MDPNMQNMISYLKIKKLVAEEETQSYSEEEEEEEEGLERESAVESRLKRTKVSLDEGGSRRRASSAASRVPAGGGAVLVPPRCSVDNCGADLEGYKKYYQRHRVCEVHSKAPAVLVDGLRQRFCQQCSRFHDLSEFDHTKRSCRRRLAGHNLRRRKSSLEFQRGGPARMQGGNQQY